MLPDSDSGSNSDSNMESVIPSSTIQSDGRKWINALLVLGAIVVALTMVRFVGQLVEWFDLESKISYVNGIAQGIGILSGLAAFIAVIKSKTSMQFLDEVFLELSKVVWADKDETTRLTFVIVIAVAITSVFLGLLDYIIGKGLNLLY